MFCLYWNNSNFVHSLCITWCSLNPYPVQHMLVDEAFIVDIKSRTTVKPPVENITLLLVNTQRKWNEESQIVN